MRLFYNNLEKLNILGGKIGCQRVGLRAAHPKKQLSFSRFRFFAVRTRTDSTSRFFPYIFVLSSRTAFHTSLLRIVGCYCHLVSSGEVISTCTKFVDDFLGTSFSFSSMEWIQNNLFILLFIGTDEKFTMCFSLRSSL